MGIRSLSTASISTGTKRSKVWDQSAVVNNNSYESIATVTVGAGGSSSISFTSIPSTYKHLQIRSTNRTNRANVIDAIDLQFNSDSTISNYVRRGVEASGAAPVASSVGYPQSGNYPFWIGYTTGANAISGAFGSYVIDILDYANTSKYKTTKSLSGYDNNGSGEISLFSHLWMNTSAINTITLTASLGTGLAQYSSFSLYGIKG
jgi:hypothetical protein